MDNLSVNPVQANLLETKNSFLSKTLLSHPDLHPEVPIHDFRLLCHDYEVARWLPVFLWTGEREVEIPNRVIDWAEYTLQDALHTFAQTLLCSCETPRPGDLVVPCRIELRDILLGNYKTIRVARDIACSECNGGGQVMGSYCRACGGKCVNRTEERFSFEIPPGSTTGNLFRFAGKGNFSLAHKLTGDLLVLFEECLPNPFRRKGVDCICEAEPDVTTFVLGGTGFVEGPLGERVYFKVPPGTQSGKVITIPGQGFPQYRTRSWGNLQCRLIPKIPSIDHGERELFIRLRELQIQRGGIQYRTQGRFGVLVIRPENDSPMIAEELVDLAVVLQTSGLVPAVDLTALVPFAPRSVLNALVAVYNRCFSRGQMKVVAHPEVAVALKSLQIGALFEVIVSDEELEGRASHQSANPFQQVRQGRWEVYPMGATFLMCDTLLGTPDLLENLEPHGHAFKAFDFSQVPQIDSFLIGKLIRVYKYANSNGGEVALIGVLPPVRKILEDTGILSLFRHVKSCDELPT
jgi:anti-anti-sigma regulatory factor